jgi:hypothetical protein
MLCNVLVPENFVIIVLRIQAVLYLRAVHPEREKDLVTVVQVSALVVLMKTIIIKKPLLVIAVKMCAQLANRQEQ